MRHYRFRAAEREAQPCTHALIIGRYRLDSEPAILLFLRASRGDVAQLVRATDS